MNSLTSLPTPALCKVVEDAAQIFSDAYVSEALKDAQQEMGNEPAVSTALAAFASTIAPVLLGDKHKAHTMSILRALQRDTDGGANTIRDLFSLVLMDKDFTTLTAAIRCHGADAVLAALYKYGTPPTMAMLSGLLETQAEQREWQTYMGDMTGSLVRALYGKNASRIPLYSDIMKKKNTVTDTRSGKEIVEDLAAKLRKRKEKRNHEHLRNDHR